MEKLSHILRAGIMLLAMISAAGCLQGLVEEEDAGDLENRHYELPVIFHVLYTDITDPLEYVSQNRFSELISAANARYKGASSSSADMGVSFRLAEKDGNGNTLRTPGVEYIRWSGEYPIDPQAFMTSRPSWSNPFGIHSHRCAFSSARSATGIFLISSKDMS